jgi:hypothetical protein
VIFPILDADGDLVTGATGLDSEVSKDQGTFADCTNEATEIATSSGMYYLDLTSTEMDADCVSIIIKTSSAGAKTTPIVLYPIEDGDIRANVVQFGSSAGTFSSGRPEVNTTHAAGTAWGSGAITAASIATDAITAAKVASDAVTEIQSGLSTLTASGVRSAVGLASANLDTQLSAIDDYLDTEVAAIKAKTDNLPASPAATGDIPSAASIADAVWDEATAGHTTGGTFGEQLKSDVDAILADTNELQTDWVNGGRLDLIIDAINAKTTNLPASPAATGDIPAASTIATAVLDVANGIETSITPREALRLILAACAGKLSGAATTTVTIRNVGDTKDRLVATVDSDGNRTAISTDVT